MPARSRPQALSEYECYYAVVRRIPRGRVLTYGDVAFLAGRPRHARRVGHALFALTDTRVPWWRVINARGEISPRLDGGPDEEQRQRLLAEGVVFNERGRVDLQRYRYRPRPAPLARGVRSRQRPAC